VPTFDGWDLRPLISNHTLRGSGSFEPLARVARGGGGYPYSVRNRAIKWLWSCTAGAPFQAALLRA
jgi:hypothetical protein